MDRPLCPKCGKDYCICNFGEPCPSCAALRGEVARLRSIVSADVEWLVQERDRLLGEVAMLERGISAMGQLNDEYRTSLSRYRAAVEWACKVGGFMNFTVDELRKRAFGE